MTEIFTRRPMHPVRAMAALAALTTVGAMLPVITSAGVATAATSCAAPTNLSPNAGTTGTAPEIKGVALSWSAPSDAPVGTKYDLEVSPNQDYTTNLTISPTTTSTRFVVPVLALPHGSYFWRVKVDGRPCWSDDAGSSAEFTSGWRNRPVLSYPAAGQTVNAADLRYSWNPIPYASSYFLQVFDNSGNSLGSCVTQGTTFSPYEVPPSAKTEAERVTKNVECGIGALPNGNYTWRVLGLDDTAVADNVTPYTGAYGVGRDPVNPITAHDGSAVTTLASDISAPSEIGQFTVGGSPQTTGVMNAKASLVGADGNFGVNCDVQDSATACPSTPTIRWTAITGADAYRVTVATDQHFTNSVRVFDTTSTSITPIDELLDSQAGQAYYVRVCSSTDVCSASDSDTPQTGQGTPASSVVSFRKRESPVTGLNSNADTALNAAAAQVTLSWSDTSVTNPLGAPTADYEVQVSGSCDYSTLGTSYTTDAAETTDVFGPGQHFWRVRAVDASGSPGPWSDGNADTPVCGSNAKSFTVTAPASAGSGSGVISTITATAPAMNYETGNLLVKKSGKWTTRKAHGATYGSALVTDGKKKEALTLTFSRSSLTVGYCAGPMDGYFSVYLDGRLVRNINSYKAFTTCGKTFILGKLSTSQAHKLVVKANNKKGSKHGTPQVVIDYFKAF